MSDFYQLNALSLSGKNVNMSDFAGNGVLVVNTASKCGFTPQYVELEALYKKYKDRNFVILGFPCNQFGNQEPGGVEEIAETYLIKYGVSFPMFAKVDVKSKSPFQSEKEIVGRPISAKVWRSGTSAKRLSLATP